MVGKISGSTIVILILPLLFFISGHIRAFSQEKASAMPPASVLQNLDGVKAGLPVNTHQPQKVDTKLQEPGSETSYKEESLTENKKEDRSKKDLKVASPENIEEISETETTFNRTYKDLLKNKSLSQFGYDFFRSVEEDRVIPAGDDYIVGPDDKLKVYLWGDPVDMLAVSREIELKVTKEGNVYIPSIGVVSVSGLRIGELKNLLKQKFNSKFRNLSVEVVLINPRKINVYVTGFVRKPGMVSATPFDTIITVISRAGGISKAGTLRKVELKRKEGKRLATVEIDFYDLFIKGLPVDINLRDGDIIHIPPIGDVVAVFGDVKRPGIYELKSESSVEDILMFSGGFNPSVSEVMVRVSRYSKDGVKLFEGSLEDKNFLKTKLYNGDFVYFGPKPEIFENSVTVQGEVYYPGIYSVNDTKTLRELILKAKHTPNADYGRVVRKDRTVVSFSIYDVLEGKFDLNLFPLDNVEIYNKFFDKEPVYVIGDIDGRTVPYYENIKLRDVLTGYKFVSDVNQLKAVILRKYNLINYYENERNYKSIDDNNKAYGYKYGTTEIEEIKNKSKSKDDIYENLKEEKSGKYAIFTTIYLKELLVKFDEEVNVELKPGDVIVIKKIEGIEKSPSVTVLGEVKNPGKYMLQGNERLSDIIKLAGGYTDKAYPQALIFIRESAIKLQKEQLETTFLTLQEEFLKKSQGLAAASQEEREVYSQAIEKSKAELEILKRKAEFGLGRIALEIPKTIEELEKSNQNISLQDGDTIIVPPKPNYVLVLGDVYNQVSLPYIEGYRLKDYLNMVGGYRKDADRKGVYVIKANGRVVSSENFSRGFLISSGLEDYKLSEGDTIVVPSEIKVPILWRPLIKDVVQIIFQSISTAVLARRL